jgi:hypothetical protein
VWPMPAGLQTRSGTSSAIRRDRAGIDSIGRHPSGASSASKGTVERWGSRGGQSMTGRVFDWLGIKDGVGLVEIGVDGSSRSVDVLAFDRPDDLGDIADLGLTLAQGKQLVALVQQEIATAQSRDHDGTIRVAFPIHR